MWFYFYQTLNNNNFNAYMELRKHWRKEGATTGDKQVSFYHGIQVQMRKLFTVTLHL